MCSFLVAPIPAKNINSRFKRSAILILCRLASINVTSQVRNIIYSRRQPEGGDLKLQSIFKLTQEIPLIMAIGTLIALMIFVFLIMAIIRLMEKKLK